MPNNLPCRTVHHQPDNTQPFAGNGGVRDHDYVELMESINRVFSRIRDGKIDGRTLTTNLPYDGTMHHKKGEAGLRRVRPFSR
ncbi:hypothetical protein [Azospirillum brasilense]|uniref:hypothetical protein n=1 Tax=Azospirillum brasilense TaxID=192 RepID=UPI0010BF7775|nr:hypothetical protein [Azospirillum brasilense]